MCLHGDSYIKNITYFTHLQQGAPHEIFYICMDYVRQMAPRVSYPAEFAVTKFLSERRTRLSVSFVFSKIITFMPYCLEICLTWLRYDLVKICGRKWELVERYGFSRLWPTSKGGKIRTALFMLLIGIEAFLLHSV